MKRALYPALIATVLAVLAACDSGNLPTATEATTQATAQATTQATTQTTTQAATQATTQVATQATTQTTTQATTEATTQATTQAATQAVTQTTVAEAAADIYEWHGYTLVLDHFATSADSGTIIGNLLDGGGAALAVLRTQDGSAVPHELILDYSDEFVLTYNGEAPTRYLNHAWMREPYWGLVFYDEAYRPDLEGYALAHQPAEPAAAVSDGAALVWQNAGGAGFTVAFATDEKVSPIGCEWPQTGYIARVKLAKTDEAEVSYEVLFAHYKDFILGDETHSYRPFDIRPFDSGDIELFFRVEGEEAPALDTLRVSVQPQGALWLNKEARDASDATQADFYPAEPQDKTYVLMLEDDSLYRPRESPLGGSAAANPDEAFDELSDQLPDVADGLAALFSGTGFTATDDPNAASVIIGIKAEYPLAGKYTNSDGQLKVNDCEMTLTAYDACTDEIIAELFYGAYYGINVSVSPGTTHVWQQLPSPERADDADKAEFTQALADFWE